MRAKFHFVFVLAALASLIVASSLFSPAAAQAGQVIQNPDGSVTYVWDANDETQNESHDSGLIFNENPGFVEAGGEPFVVTSNPGTFTGPDVAPIIGADTFYSNGITGQSTITSNVEAGHIWGTATGHETLTHVTSYTNDVSAPGAGFGTPAYDRHATWVGMMIGGRQAGAVPGLYQQGIAYNTDLRSGAIATSWGVTAYALSFSATTTSLDFPYSSAVSGFGTVDVINSSWGGTDTTGMSSRATITDGLANANPNTTFVVSAGNSGPGANTIGSPGSGYNNITVAALQNNGSNVYNSVASFSSRGPQDYGDPVNGTIVGVRAAVDIAAPGTSLTSAFYGGTTGGNDASIGGTATGGPTFYSGGLGGTSFASPITAGGVALMHSAAYVGGLSTTAHDTRVVKAALLNAASKIPGWNNGEVAHPNGNGGVRTTQSLDYASGAGALDLDRTYDQYLTGQLDIAGLAGGATANVIGWDYATVGLGASTDIVITTPLQAGSEFRSTLSWFRDRTYVDATTQIDVGFADLNLEIWDSTFTTLYSDSISMYNPVEHLTFDLPVTGLYGIRVDYPTNVFGNISAEEFGLAWWGVAAATSAVPEPSTIVAMLSMLLTGLLLARRRRNARG